MPALSLQATCIEWHADNRHICTTYGDTVSNEIGNFSGTYVYIRPCILNTSTVWSSKA